MLTDVEFYNSPEGDVVMKQVGQPVRTLQEKDRDIISALLQIIGDRYPEALKALETMYDRYGRNQPHKEFLMVRRFARCNFGEYNQLEMDIDHFANIHFEEVSCPLRGTGDCPFEQIICKPKVSSHLTSRELNVLQHIAVGYTTAQIAELLHISAFTVLRHRNNIKHKLKLNNTAQLTSYYNALCR